MRGRRKEGMFLGRQEKLRLDWIVYRNVNLAKLYWDSHKNIECRRALDHRIPAQGEVELLWSPEASCHWDRLIVSVLLCPPLPTIHKLKSYAQCDSIRRWAFGKWSGCEDRASWMELWSYQRGSTEVPSPFHHVRTQWEASSLQSRREPSAELDHAPSLIFREEMSRWQSNHFRAWDIQGYPGRAIQQTVKNITGAEGKVQENYKIKRTSVCFYNG